MYSDSFVLQLNLLAIMVLITIVCSLLFRRNNVTANSLLACIVLYPALSIAMNVIFIIFRKHELLFLAPLNIGVNLTFGPVLLCYLGLIQGKSVKQALRNFWHFFPTLIVLLSAIYYSLIPESEKILSMNKLLAGDEDFINIINLLLLIHVGIYLYTAWNRVTLYEQTAADLGIYESKISTKWQRSFLICIIVVNVLLLLAFALPILITGKAHIYSDLIAVPVVALIMYVFMIYKGFSYHVIFNKSAYETFANAVAPLNQFIEEVEMLEKPQKKTRLRSEFGDEINQKLEQLFDVQKIYTKPGLKLHDVATLLDMSPAVLSSFINTHLNITFFEMVNQYRVEEAKRLLILKDYQHYKIEYIGEISGFNSRASFFSVFKKHLGKTPQAFKDEHSQ